MNYQIEQAANIISCGFVEGGNKDNFKSPFLNHTPKDWEHIKGYKWICGIIAENIIMVDYDDENIFNCRLKIARELNQHCIVIKGANKGGHFYWFNSGEPIKSTNRNKTLLTLYPVDYKSGRKQIKSTGEIKPAKCVASFSKEDGTFRDVLYFNPKDDNILDEIPFYDFPLKADTKYNFFDMGENSGRQDGLFTYMIPIKNAGYSYEQFKEVATLIEKYIFSEPLGDEFENTIRREAWDSIEVVDNSKKDIEPETFKRFIGQLGLTIRYNELLNLIEYDKLPEQGNYKNINDISNVMPIRLQYDFKKYTHKSVTKQIIIDLIQQEADINSYNPIKDYLQDEKWDSVDRFPYIFDILGVTDTFQQSLIKKWFYQTAAMPFNTLQAPFGAEGVLILQGDEGTAKSRFFEQICPNPLWYKSLVNEFSTNNKDILIKTLSAWIFEIGEIDRTFKSNKSDIKNFVTSPKDDIRKPYAREPIIKSRTTSLCGTTNKSEILHSDTGLRRWWVIPIKKKIIMGDFIEPNNLHQFWAQCYETFKQNPLCFRLSDEDMDVLKSNNKNMTEMLPAEGELRQILDFDADESKWKWLSPSILITLPEYKVCNYKTEQIGKALTNIMQDEFRMKKTRSKKGMQYFIPPAIHYTDRNWK